MDTTRYYVFVHKGCLYSPEFVGLYHFLSCTMSVVRIFSVDLKHNIRAFWISNWQQWIQWGPQKWMPYMRPSKRQWLSRTILVEFLRSILEKNDETVGRFLLVCIWIRKKTFFREMTARFTNFYLPRYDLSFFGTFGLETSDLRKE